MLETVAESLAAMQSWSISAFEEIKNKDAEKALSLLHKLHQQSRRLRYQTRNLTKWSCKEVTPKLLSQALVELGAMAQVIISTLEKIEDCQRKYAFTVLETKTKSLFDGAKKNASALVYGLTVLTSNIGKDHCPLQSMQKEVLIALGTEGKRRGRIYKERVLGQGA